jgi:hypothetical protein
LEILQRRLPFHNSLGVHATLLRQPSLLNDPEDPNYVRDVFLFVPTGEDRHADVGLVGKLDIENGRIFLGRDEVYHRYVRDGRPLSQLPFLALDVLQHVWRLDVGSHLDVGVTPESSP